MPCPDNNHNQCGRCTQRPYGQRHKSGERTLYNEVTPAAFVFFKYCLIAILVLLILAVIAGIALGLASKYFGIDL